MRAIHSFDRIPSSVATPFVIMGGYFGYCGGGWIGAELVDDGVGLKGLRWMLITAAAGLVMASVTKFRLAIEEEESGREPEHTGEHYNYRIRNKQEKGTPGRQRYEAEGPAVRQKTGKEEEEDVKGKVAFWPLFIIASWICTGTSITVSLLPTHIYESGLGLDFGGFSSFMFGAGVGIGGVLWGIYAHRIGEFKASVMSLIIGPPFLFVYLLFSTYKPAVVILLVCGFCTGGAYPMLVSMARNAKEMNLGRRMGFMVGGVWGIASLLLIGAGSTADITGTYAVLFGAAGCFLAGGIYGIYLIRTGYGQIQ
jgi:MFS family permease